MDAERVRALAANGETISIEYKSDRKLNDNKIVEAAACMANGPGGTILLGVEDDGRITGAVRRHGDRTNADLIRALILNKTQPPLMTTVTVLAVGDRNVVAIEVPAADTPVGTTGGVYRRRTITTDGKPACKPYEPQEMFSSYFSLSGRDYAEVEIPDAPMDALDPMEFERFRQLAAQGSGDRTLAELSDIEIARALGVVRIGAGTDVAVTIGAVLLFGTESSLKRYAPTAEAGFQLLEGTALQANEVFRAPLFKSAEQLHSLVMARNVEEEITWGLLRIAIPLVPQVAVREVVANALVHRDYAERGMVAVQLSPDALRIDSPGGFPRGVTLDNLIEVSRPRSRTLADAFKRAGIVERSGRGVSRSYEALLRIGRNSPDYSRSTDAYVSVSMDTGRADLEMARFIASREHEAGRSLDLDEMRVLHEIRSSTSSTARELSDALKLRDATVKNVVAHLVEQGIIEVRGSGRGRRYHLSAAFYRSAKDPAAYVRLRGTDRIQQEQMILQYVTSHGRITRSEAADLCMISPTQASHLLRRLAGNGRLELRGERRGAHYVLGTRSS